MRALVPLLIAALPAWADTGPSATMGICHSVAEPGEIHRALRAEGWSEVTRGEEAAFAETLAAGMTIALNNALAADVDWEEIRSDSDDLAQTMLRSSSQGAPLRLYRAQGAALSVFRGDDDGRGYIHCLYAGPSDETTRALMKVNARIDAAAGRRSRNEEFRTYTFRRNGREGPIGEIDMQVSIYNDPGTPVAGEVPEVELGFSSYSFPAR